MQENSDFCQNHAPSASLLKRLAREPFAAYGDVDTRPDAELVQRRFQQIGFPGLSTLKFT